MIDEDMGERLKVALRNIRWWFSRQVSYSQFLPSKEDLECEETKELSKKLIGDSYKETLTNIVEWQERNLQYWHERAEMFTLLYILSAIAFFFVLPQNLWMIPLIIIIFWLFLGDFMTFFIGALILISEVIVAIVVFVYVANTSIIIRSVGLSIIFGSIFSLLLYGMLKYRCLKASLPEFKFADAFKSSLPIRKILQYRLAVCRDYAKLTATLLISSYGLRNSIYFITIPQHVAAAIEIKDKMYVLDQSLPVMTFNKWINYWSEKLSGSFLSKVYSSIYRILGGDVQLYKLIANNGTIKVRKICYKKLGKVRDIPQLDVDIVTNEVAYSLGISQLSNKSEPDTEINLKYFAIRYDRDEIVEFSLTRAIKNKLDSELCGNMRKITKIELSQDKSDFTLAVHMS